MSDTEAERALGAFRFRRRAQKFIFTLPGPTNEVCIELWFPSYRRILHCNHCSLLQDARPFGLQIPGRRRAEGVPFRVRFRRGAAVGKKSRDPSQ